MPDADNIEGNEFLNYYKSVSFYDINRRYLEGLPRYLEFFVTLRRVFVNFRKDIQVILRDICRKAYLECGRIIC